MTVEQYALALLVGGVTGAGLVLTAYTLGASKATEIIQSRFQQFQESKVRLGGRSKNVRLGMSDADFNKMKSDIRSDLDQIEAYRGLPSWAGGTPYLSFLLYVLTTLLSMYWFWLAPDQQKQPVMVDMSVLFGVATLSFLFMGLAVIGDIRQALRKKFETITSKT